MQHQPIEIGKEVGGHGVRCTDPHLAAFLAVPEIARFLAEGLAGRASEIEADIDHEVREEITRNVDLAYADEAYLPGQTSYSAEAEQLELDAVAEADPIARKELMMEAQRLREESRRGTRLEARAASRANALQRGLDRLGSKEREATRDENKRYARMLREVATQIDAGVSTETDLAVSSWALDRHACIFGSSGSGKTRLVLHLLTEQMKAGCSVLAIDAKPEAIRDLLSCAIAAGVSPDDVILMKPGDGMSVPGWNPFLGDDEPEVAAGSMHSFFTGLTTFGPRMVPLLKNALIVVATHRLSLMECRPLMTSAAYRHALLEREPPQGAKTAYRNAVRYFRETFENTIASSREETVHAVENRLNDLLDVPFFSALLCAKRNTLDLADLWRRQKIVIVHLDQRQLSMDGSRIVGGLLAYQAYLTAMKIGSTPGVTPVVLALDEIGTQEKFLGESLGDITSFSRSQGLRILVATQHFTKISPPLLEALLGNAKLQAFFQISEKDARSISGNLAAKEESGKAEIPRLEISAGQQYQTWVLPLCGENGDALTPYSPPIVEVVREDDEEEIKFEVEPPCPQPFTQADAPTPPTIPAFTMPHEVALRLHKVEHLRWEAERLNASIRNQSITRVSSVRPHIHYGHAEFTENRLREGSVEYIYTSVDGFKREETWGQLLLDRLYNTIHGLFYGSSRRRKPLTGMSQTERADKVTLSRNDLLWKKRKEEYDAQEGERRKVIEKYNADVAVFMQQAHARNEEIRQWHAHVAALTQKMYEEAAAAAEARYEEAVARAEAEREATRLRREEQILEQTQREFTDSSRLTDLFYELRCAFDDNQFGVYTDNDTYTDLAGLLRRLRRSGLHSELVWRLDDVQDAILLFIPEVMITESDTFNPSTKADWERMLQLLPSRHAAVRTAYDETSVLRSSLVRIVDVADSIPEKTPRFQAFIKESLQSNSQSAEEIAEVERWRYDQVDELAGTQGKPSQPKPARGRKTGEIPEKTPPPQTEGSTIEEDDSI